MAKKIIHFYHIFYHFLPRRFTRGSGEAGSTSRQAYIAESTTSCFTLPMQKSFVKIPGATANCRIYTKYYKSIHYTAMN